MTEELYTVRCTEDFCHYGEFTSIEEAEDFVNELRLKAKEEEGEFTPKFFYVERVKQ